MTYLPALSITSETAKLIFNHVYHHYDILEDIVSDKGLQLTSWV